jgi:aspartyl/glutamyl-tRNA(Asn/Gln) amidotransferase C subunit
MSVTVDHIDQLSKLVALNLSDTQKAEFAPQLDAIVWLVSKLESLDLTDIQLVPSHIVGHMNDVVEQSDFDFLSNIRHPIAGQMPAVSFTTRGD